MRGYVIGPDDNKKRQVADYILRIHIFAPAQYMMPEERGPMRGRRKDAECCDENLGSSR